MTYVYRTQAMSIMISKRDIRSYARSNNVTLQWKLNEHETNDWKILVHEWFYGRFCSTLSRARHGAEL